MAFGQSILGGNPQGSILGGQPMAPRVPWGQNPMVTMAGLSLLGAPTLQAGFQNLAKNAPYGMNAKAQMQDQMLAQQEKAATKAEVEAEKQADAEMWNTVMIARAKGEAPTPELLARFYQKAPSIADKWYGPKEPEKPMVVGNDSQLYDPATQQWMTPPGGGERLDFSDVSSLRKEIQALPSYKNTAQAVPIYKAMVETFPNKTRASDLNLVYGLGKIMDPTSVVREGEMIMVKDTASLPDWLLGEINRLNGGQALQEDTRRAILAEAKTRMDAYLQQWESDAGQYRGIANRYGIPEEDAIPTFGDLPAIPQPAAQPPTATPRMRNPETGEEVEWNGTAWVPVP